MSAKEVVKAFGREWRQAWSDDAPPDTMSRLPLVRAAWSRLFKEEMPLIGEAIDADVINGSDVVWLHRDNRAVSMDGEWRYSIWMPADRNRPGSCGPSGERP